MTIPYNKQQKQGIFRIVDFAVELKESEKKDTYLDLAREMKKKLWHMKVTIIPIVIGALDTFTEGFVQ